MTGRIEATVEAAQQLLADVEAADLKAPGAAEFMVGRLETALRSVLAAVEEEEPAEARQLPAYGPTEVFGGVDEPEPAVIVVRVALALTRAQLVTLLGVGFAGLAADRTPESLTDDEVRREVEGTLAVDALVELDRQMERDKGRVFPPVQQAVMDVLAAAVDRAYPGVSR